jgi:hypothetical protein
MRKYENGFIYYYIYKVGKGIDDLNLIKWFKKLFIKIAKKKCLIDGKDDYIRLNNIAIDIYILLKFIILTTFWALGVNHFVANIVLWYLVFMTVWTYFKYHFWKNDTNKSFHRLRRRFISLFLSLFFVTMTFAYFIDVGHESEFSLQEENEVYILSSDKVDILMIGENNVGEVDAFNAIKHSFSNVFINDFSRVIPITSKGEIILIVQSLITFIYLVLILSKSLLE